jgi:hypothetical protein
MPESERKIKLKRSHESFPFMLVKCSVRCIRSSEHVSGVGMAAQRSQVATWGSKILGLAYFTTSLSLLIMLNENNFCLSIVHIFTIR